MRNNKRMLRDNKKAILFMTVVFVSFWIWGSKPGLGQKQEHTRFTVETHDKTNFPLVGRHRTVSCGECHLDGILEGTPTACEACHWMRRQDDRHQLRLGLHCGDCHTPFSWKNVAPNKWNHLGATGYSLRGVHKTLDCVDCHGEEGFQRFVVDCVDCHEEEFSEARNPDHMAAGFPTQCQLCHRSNSRWEGAAFSHASFVLRGNHKTAECTDCHAAVQYPGLSSACVSCHLGDYNSAGDPDHKASGFPTDCEVCHGTNANSWEGAEFDHSVFILRGRHRSARCSDCHAGGQYAGIPSECINCHQEDYSRTDDPNHQALNFPTDCEICHGNGATSWENGDLSHEGFVLKGVHTTLDCTGCHVNNQFAGLPSSCISCHQEDYNRTDDPNHQALDFPTDCEICHGTASVSWESASFDHSSIWMLRGAHTQLDCSRCHQRGYDLPRNCYGCHAQDYDSTTDPNHGAAGFPTDCQTCHYPTHFSWSQAVFDHEFPLGSGNHASASCSDCHISSNFKQFSCLACHTHDKTRMDNEHQDVTGYVYESQACYACHPQGRE